jgi:hypothetical protein
MRRHSNGLIKLHKRGKRGASTRCFQLGDLAERLSALPQMIRQATDKVRRMLAAPAKAKGP